MQRVPNVKVAWLLQPFAQRSCPNIPTSFEHILQGSTFCPTNTTKISQTMSNILTSFEPILLEE